MSSDPDEVTLGAVAMTIAPGDFVPFPIAYPTTVTSITVVPATPDPNTVFNLALPGLYRITYTLNAGDGDSIVGLMTGVAPALPTVLDPNSITAATGSISTFTKAFIILTAVATNIAIVNAAGNGGNLMLVNFPASRAPTPVTCNLIIERIG